MRKSKFSEAKRLAILTEHEKGESVDAICRKYQISAATFYKWKKSIADAKDEDKRRLKELEQENARLKKMYAELSMDHDILQQGYALLKKWQAQDDRKS